MIGWGADLSVGWDEIDAQHREILVRVSDLRLLVERGDDFGAQAALDALVDIVVLHFATEQDLMDRSGYPDRVAHKGAHDLFLQDLHALSAEIDEVGLTEQVHDWIQNRMAEWLAFHIQTNDLPLGRHLARLRHGSRAAPAALKPEQS